MEIIRGTTPTIIFQFKDISPTDISQCYLLIKQKGQTVIEKSISDATVTSESLSFTLAQEDTFALATQSPTQVMLDWKTIDGVRGRSVMYECNVKVEGKSNVY